MKISALTGAGTLAVIVALAVLTSHHPSWAQADYGMQTEQVYSGSGWHYSAAEGELRSRISFLVQQLRQAESQEEREKVTGELRKLFAQYFDADLEARQKQVEDLKERIAQLEAQMEKRRQGKDEIIDLQLKVIRNEAEGLGFFGEVAADGYADGHQQHMYRDPDQPIRTYPAATYYGNPPIPAPSRPGDGARSSDATYGNPGTPGSMLLEQSVEPQKTDE